MSPWLTSGRQRYGAHLFVRSSPRMTGRWDAVSPASRGHSIARGGRRLGPGGDLAKGQTPSPVLDGNLPGLVLPHQHPAAGRSVVLALPRQLQQPALVTHHPVRTHHPLLLQPERLVELPRRGLTPVIIVLRSRRPRRAPVVPPNVPPPQKAAPRLVAADPHQPQLLRQPVLMRAVSPLPPALR